VTDQVYYQIQYPMKKAINIMKELDMEAEVAPQVKTDLNEGEIAELKNFVNEWEDKGKVSLKGLIEKLRNK